MNRNEKGLKQPEGYEDEVDLVELIMVLANKWKVIVVATFISLLSAVVFLSTTSKTYAVTSEIIATHEDNEFSVSPPFFSSKLNLGNKKERENEESHESNQQYFFQLSTADALKLLLLEFNSKDSQSKAKNQIDDFTFSNVSARKDSARAINVTLSGVDAARLKNTARAYTELTIDSFLSNVQKQRQRAVENKISELENLLSAIKYKKTDQAQNSIALINNALQVAKELGIREPSVRYASVLSAENGLLTLKTNEQILRLVPLGTDALEKLRQTLQGEALKSDSELDVIATIEYLKSIEKTTFDKSFYHIEVGSVELKGPKSMLVVGLALVLGFMLGVSIALLLNALEKRKTK